MNLYAITFLLNSFLFTYSLRILYGFSFLSLVEKMWIWSHFVKRLICGYYVLCRCLAWRGQSLSQWKTPLALYFLSKFLQWLILARPERANHLQVIIAVHLFFIPATQSPGWSSLIFTRLSFELVAINCWFKFLWTPFSEIQDGMALWISTQRSALQTMERLIIICTHLAAL